MLEGEGLQPPAVQLQILAELLGQLACLIDTGRIREGGGDAPLLPTPIGQRQAGPQPQLRFRRGNFEADTGAQVPQGPVDPREVGVPAGNEACPLSPKSGRFVPKRCLARLLVVAMLLLKTSFITGLWGMGAEGIEPTYGEL